VSQNDIHLLENYGTAATKTLCGIAVPQMWGSARGNLHWAHAGHETCADCQKVQQARVGQVAAPPLPTIKARPLTRVVKKSGGSPP
jgi:hypothetical protein